MTLRAFILLLIIAGASHAMAANEPLRDGLDRLKSAIEELGAPRAGEVSSERAELERVRSGLERRARDIASDRSAVDSEKKSLDMLSRERDDRLKQIDLDQKAHDSDYANLMRRVSAIRAEIETQKAALAAAKTRAETERANAWGREGDARLALLRREGTLLDDRNAAIGRRRADIASDIIGYAQRSNWLQKRRSLVDGETARILAECSTALSRVLALKQIANLPSRAIVYAPPSALADKVVGDLFLGIAKEGALAGLEGKLMVKVLAKVGLKAQPVGLAYTVADTFADIAIAGVDQRTNEVTKNLFLIGDYGAVMKKMIRAQGASATQDPKYQAMRAEIVRIAADMPSNDAQVLIQGLDSSSALGAALTAAAGQYTSKKIGRALGTITNHLNNSQRAALGSGGVTFFRKSLEVLGSVVGDVTVKQSAEEIADASRLAREARSQP